MNVSSVTTFGSAAIASPPASDTATARPEERPASPAEQIIEAAKQPGTGQNLDIKV
jgi:hypothetical protein